MTFDYPLGKSGWFPAANAFAESIGHVSNYPMAYVFAIFLALSGHLIGRNAYIRYATPLYANSYVCLVGPSGLSHKSTAMALGIESLGNVADYLEIPRSVTTSQGLLVSMRQGGGAAMLVLDEMAILLNKKRQDFAADLLARIVELYACPPTAGTYTRVDPIKVKDTFLTIIAGSTIEWLRTALTADDLMAGFGNRMTFILGDPRTENPWPRNPFWERIDWEQLMSFTGRVQLDENAQNTWTEFYEKFIELQKRTTPFVRVMAERVPEKILKTALIMGAWQNSNIIDEEIIESAIDWGRYLYACIDKLTPAFEHAEKQILVAIKDGADTRSKLFTALSHVFPTKRIRESILNLQWLGLLVDDNGQFQVKKGLDRPRKP